MSEDFTHLTHGKGFRYGKAWRNGTTLITGFEPHQETTTYPDEAAAIAGFHAYLKVMKRKGFVTKTVYDAKHDAEDEAAHEVMETIDRRRLLRDGERFGAAKLGIEEHGSVLVRSGKLLACDPFIDGPHEPFMRRVPKGRHRVTMSLVTEKRATRCAAATIHFSKGAVARLEKAIFAGAKKRDAFGVDAGTACFVDHAAFVRIDEHARDAIVKGMKKARTSGFGWAAHELDPKTGLDVVAFTSGLGDGAYVSYWGWSRAKKLLSLTIDFAVLTAEQWSRT